MTQREEMRPERPVGVLAGFKNFPFRATSSSSPSAWWSRSHLARWSRPSPTN